MRQLAGLFSGRRPWAPVLAPLLVFSEALTGRRTLIPADGFITYLPWFTRAARAWRAAEIPGWNPYSFAGSPLLAISQAGVYYPPNWLFVVLPPVPAVNLVIVMQFVIAGVGAWLLTRHLTGDTTAAAVAGVAFALCGFMFAHIGHSSMIASAAWLPWVLFGYERLRIQFRPANLLMAGGALALSFLAGHSQLACIALMVLGLYALGVRCFVPRSERGRPLLAAFALLVVAGGLSAAQLFPTLRYVGLSERANLTYDQAVEYSFPGSHTPLFLFPYLFGNGNPDGPFASPYRGRFNLTELSGYPGMAALVLAGAGVGAARRDRRLVALAGAGVMTGALALGSETPLSRVVFHLPVYGQFRAWGRYVVVLDLVVAVFAAYGVARLRRPDSRRRALAGAGAAGVGVALAGAVLPRLGPVEAYLPPGGVRLASVGLPVVGALAGAVCAVLLAAGRPRFRPALAGALAVVAVALDAAVSFGFFYEWRTGSPPAEVVAEAEQSRTTFWGGVDDRAGGLDRYLFIGGDIAPALPDFVGFTDYKGLRSANGSGPLAPAGYLEAMGMSGFGGVGIPERVWGRGGRALDLLRVTTVVVETASSPDPPSDGPLVGGRPIAGTSLVRYTHDPALPEAFVVGRAETRSRPQVLQRLWGITPFDPTRSALLEHRCRSCPAQGSPGPAGRARRISWSDNEAAFDVVASRPAMLVVSQAWLPGWEASVGGKRAPVVRVDGIVQGVPVPSGQHRVMLRYTAPGARAGLALSIATLMALVAWLVVERRKRPAPEATSLTGSPR